MVAPQGSSESVLLARAASADEILKRALHVGQIGTWQWVRPTGQVFWDEQLARLFGLVPGATVERFEQWVERIHADDRQRVLAALDQGISDKASFRFDHRCVWPDGTVHWLEGIGEVELDGAGEVVGAIGVAANVDERHRVSDQFARLLQIERTARERSDYLARTNEVLVHALHLDEVIEQVTAAAVPELADWCSVVVTMDRPADDPLISIAHADPEMVMGAKRLQGRFPYDPNAPTGAPAVIRSGVTAFVPVIDAKFIEAVIDDHELRDIVIQLDLRSSITVALRSTLGVLGALQLVRTSAAPQYTEADVALAEDLAGTIGAALGNAIVYRRQLRARSALETLQRLTGRLAEAVTVEDISRAVVTFGAAGLGADTGLLYLRRSDGVLELVASTGYEPGDLDDWETIDPSVDAPVNDALRTHTPMIFRDRSELDARYPYMAGNPVPDSALIALPLEIRARQLGSLVFAFRHAHTLSDEELTMLATLTARCAGALERARLYDEEHHVAMTLQASLLPGVLRAPPGMAVAARYWPANVGSPVGGDFYDIFPLGDGRWGVTIGDICGKGVEAAALTAVARHTIRAAARHLTSPSDVLHATHHALAAYDGTTYCTVCFGYLEGTGDGRYELSMALGGHPTPLFRYPDGRVEPIGVPGTILGLIEPSFVDSHHDLGPGSTLVLFTDGITDAPQDMAVSAEALEQLLRDHGRDDPDRIADRIRSLIEGHRPLGSGDDTALLILQSPAR